MLDLENAGGISAVINSLIKQKLFNGNIITVSGKTQAENCYNAIIKNPEVIRTMDNAYNSEGGIAILKGNLAPLGAVVKSAGVKPEMMIHRGPARVYNSEEEAFNAIMKGIINPRDVIVIRYEGPKGCPGMREMLSPTAALIGMGLEKSVALITDGRFSGGT